MTQEILDFIETLKKPVNTSNRFEMERAIDYNNCIDDVVAAIEERDFFNQG